MMTEKEFYIWAGGKIKSLREQKRITQEELARITGFDRSLISKFENTGKKISAFRIKQMLEAMGHTLADLTNGEPDEKKNELTLTISGNLNGNTLEKIKDTLEVLLSPGRILDRISEQEEQKEREKCLVSGDASVQHQTKPCNSH